MFFTSLLVFFTCTWMLNECTAEDVYALANKEAKLYFDYNQPWNKSEINKDGEILALIQKTSADVKLSIAGKGGISVKYIDKTNLGMVTIRNVSSSYYGNITMRDTTSGTLLKQWHVHVLERPPANPFIRESSPPWAGQDYQLNCSGDSFGVTESKWYKEGQLLTPNAKYTVTGNKLTIRNIEREDRPKLTCVVVISDDIQSNNSDIFSVDVLYGPDNIKITSEPPDFAIEDGKSITLKCDATCHPPCHFQWSGIVYAIGSLLEVQYMTSNQNGPYTCTATNLKSATKIKGETVYLKSEKQVTETFNKTESSTECTAEDVYALANKEAKLYFDYNLTWNKADINKGGVILASIQKTSADVKLSIAGIDGISVNYIDKTNQGMVTIGNVSSSYNGNITMRDITSGTLLKQWHVHVLERPPANPIIRESSPPWAGQDYQLNCSGDSFGVTESKWYKGGQLLTPNAKYSVTGNKLTIRNIQREDRPKLTCVVVISDDIQSNNSDIFSVDVLYGPDNIKITSEPPDFAIEDGKSITLKCDATCHPPCHFQWSGIVYAIGSSLEVQYMTSNQNGPYTCTATNPKSMTKIKGETVYLKSEKQVTETFKKTESSTGVPIYVIIPMAIVILVMVGYVIWMHQKRLSTLETDRPHSREECNYKVIITPTEAEIHLPIPPVNDGHASDSRTEQFYSTRSILHTNQNMCLDQYEKVDVASTDAGERVCNSNETVYEPMETISNAVDDKLGYLTVIGV